jgi:hypothetical protein
MKAVALSARPVARNVELGASITLVISEACIVRRYGELRNNHRMSAAITIGSPNRELGILTSRADAPGNQFARSGLSPAVRKP